MTASGPAAALRETRAVSPRITGDSGCARESSQRRSSYTPCACVTGDAAVLISAADRGAIERYFCGVIPQLASDYEGSGCVHCPGPRLIIVNVRGTGCRVFCYIPAEKASDGRSLLRLNNEGFSTGRDFEIGRAHV